MEPFASVPGRHDSVHREAVDAAVDNLRRATRQANLGTFTGYRIGLDIGNGNIGWCVLFEDGYVPRFLTGEAIKAHNAALPARARRTQLPDLDSFVPLGTHKFRARDEKGVSLSKGRAVVRAKRGALDARQMRKWHLRRALENARLLPRAERRTATGGLHDPKRGAIGGHACIKADVLRVNLLDPAFEAHPHDLGRALYNALKRRGWMKPRGRAGEDSDSAFGKAQTERYRAVLKRFDCRTVGEFLEVCARDARADNVPFRKRHRTLAAQKMDKAKPKDREAALKDGKSYEAFRFLTPTFELIWEEARRLRAAQRHSIRIPRAAWKRIADAAGYRRDLRGRKPGPCQFLAGELRCIRALPSFQELRILQQANNLRISGRPLDGDRFQAVLDALRSQPRIGLRTLAQQVLRVPPAALGRKDEATGALAGARTDLALTAVLGESWTSLALEERDRWVLRFLRRKDAGRAADWDEDRMAWTDEDETALERECAAAFGPDALERIDANAAKEFEDNFASVSLRYARAAIGEYAKGGGRSHVDVNTALGVPEPRIELFERLPYYGRVMPDLTVDAAGFAPLERTCAEERAFGRAANPDVHVVLNRVRKVVNAIIDMMGGILPSSVAVEIARDALSDAQAEAYSRQARDREKLRRAIERDIALVFEGRQMPFGPRLDRLVDRWTAAFRQGWRDYDGTPIQRSHLADGGTYELDHVSPAAFGEFRAGNIFVTALNQQKRRRLPWEAFAGEHKESLVAFATFGWTQRKKVLRSVLETKGPRMRADDRKRLEARIAQADARLAALEEHGPPRPDVLASLQRTLTGELDKLFEDAGAAPEEVHGLKPFTPSEQAALFTRFDPDARPPEDYAARDAANIGWSTKLVARYVLHIGARSVSVKPWAVRALRCMLDINKDRKDLRNHAVDAFLVAHFDEHVMLPAFAAFRNHPFGLEAIYRPDTLRAVLDAVANSDGVFAAILENIEALDREIEFIATAHRPDNMWNPGDPEGGSFGALGGENIYAFRPDGAQRKQFTVIVAQLRREPVNGVLTKREFAAILARRSNDLQEVKLKNRLAKSVEVRYRTRTGETAKTTNLKYEAALPLTKQPGALIDGQAKFAVASATREAKREVVSKAYASSAPLEARTRIFRTARTVFRPGDTVISEGAEFVVTGMQSDGRLIAYLVNNALRVKEDKTWITVPARPTDSTPQKVTVDVLGRRLYRRRKTSGDLESVSYRLRDK